MSVTYSCYLIFYKMTHQQKFHTYRISITLRYRVIVASHSKIQPCNIMKLLNMKNEQIPSLVVVLCIAMPPSLIIIRRHVISHSPSIPDRPCGSFDQIGTGTLFPPNASASPLFVTSQTLHTHQSPTLYKASD